jgi:hypothetical protein
VLLLRTARAGLKPGVKSNAALSKGLAPINTTNWLAQNPVLRRPPATALSLTHLIVCAGVALSAVVWGTAFILGGHEHQLQSYLSLLGLYAVCSAAFIMARIRRGKLQLFEIPVFITLIGFLQFGLVPLRNFTDPSKIDANLSGNGEELVQALSYVVLGMLAFWIGSEQSRRIAGNRVFTGLRTQAVEPDERKAGPMLRVAVLYLLALATKVYLLKNHLFAYTGSLDKYYENLASMQVLNYVAQFGTLALIVATIKRYRERHDPAWKAVFVVILVSEVFWGLISGMKGFILQNFVVLALVSSFLKQKLNLRWLLSLFLGLVVIYPVSNAYRSVLNKGDVEVTSFAEAAEAGRLAFSDTQKGESTVVAFWREGVDRALQRLDLLTNVAQIIALGSRASMVKGDVQWWMLPFYPFIPRFIWPSKPVLDEGGRFTAALQGGHWDAISVGSSTAVTYPGDLYLQFGLLGIPIGMFILGIVTQWFTNRMSRSAEPRDLFVYATIFVFGFPYEIGTFDLWATLIKVTAIVYVVRWVVYGPRKRISGKPLSTQASAHRSLFRYVQQ